ncbi:Bacteriophytochrome cph2 [Chromobacterium vaccinii]|nr:Bacteriophytochrome cph2 [Chromobacterium vaccinii]
MLPLASRVEACNVADRLRLAIANLQPRVGELQLSISASIGVACLRPPEHENLASLFLEADLLLYQAKRKGRNRVEIEREPEPEAQH